MYVINKIIVRLYTNQIAVILSCLYVYNKCIIINFTNQCIYLEYNAPVVLVYFLIFRSEGLLYRVNLKNILIIIV